jgi:hypothetical protein
VVATNSNWAGGARDAEASREQERFHRLVQRAVDEENTAVASSGLR